MIASSQTMSPIIPDLDTLDGKTVTPCRECPTGRVTAPL